MWYKELGVLCQASQGGAGVSYMKQQREKGGVGQACNTQEKGEMHCTSNFAKGSFVCGIVRTYKPSNRHVEI